MDVETLIEELAELLPHAIVMIEVEPGYWRTVESVNVEGRDGRHYVLLSPR